MQEISIRISRLVSSLRFSEENFDIHSEKSGHRAFTSCTSTLPFLHFLSDAQFVYWVPLLFPTSCFPCTGFGKTASIQWGLHSEAQL